MKNNKGFTLIELLAVMTIIVILSLISIPAVTRMIDRSKSNGFESQKKLVMVAAKSYAQSNRKVLPKSVEEPSTINLQTLKDSGYLKDDIKSSSGSSCMTNSSVIIYKKANNKYTYEVSLNCGS